MAEAQKNFFMNNAKLLPKPYKGIHKYPMPMPEHLTKKSPQKKVC